MDKRIIAPEGMVVTPHHLATQSAMSVLREGGTAIEATVAAAATLTVVLPHQNSIGGDGFWLIIPPHSDPLVIQACGPAGSLVSEEFFKGHKNIPYTGPKSAITVAGVVAGWQEALNYVTESGYNRFSVSRLLSDAINYAENGFPVSSSFNYGMKKYKNGYQTSRSFDEYFLKNDNIVEVGDRFYQKRIAVTLKSLANSGLNDFYKGELASLLANDFEKVGMPLTKQDLFNYCVERKSPLKLQHSNGLLLNIPPPSQGLSQLYLLGILDRVKSSVNNEGQLIHTAVEGIKEAFELRDKFITDPRIMARDPQWLLDGSNIAQKARNVDPNRAKSSPIRTKPADTVWMGVMDNKGFSVSYIQSIYHQFGSGVILPKTGILWQNRGVSFNLNPDHILSVKPGKLPLHTLMPGAAILNDGRIMVYGSQGGDGQPQFMASVFQRYVVQGLNLSSAIAAPRWLYGRIMGENKDILTIEDRFSKDTVDDLKRKGHNIKIVEAFSRDMGNAGALVRYPNGMIEGASDPRSDGSAAGY